VVSDSFGQLNTLSRILSFGCDAVHSDGNFSVFWSCTLKMEAIGFSYIRYSAPEYTALHNRRQQTYCPQSWPRQPQASRSLCPILSIYCGPGSSVGIATDYGLNGPGIESRWEIFRPSRLDLGPTSLLYNGYRVFPGGKLLLGRAVDHSPPSNAAVKKGKSIPLLTLEAI
jgi:hypothetical protein